MIYQNTRRTYQAVIRLCSAALLMTAVTPLVCGQEDVEEKQAIIRNSPGPGVIEIENDAVVEAGKSGEVEIRTFKRPIGGPAGVEVISPDEEIVIDTKPKKPTPPKGPKPPKVEKKIRITNGDGDEEMARRMERLEQKLEAMSERNQSMRRNEIVLNDKAMAKVQREVDRAAREADVAIRKFHFAHPGGEDAFAFEHKFHIAGTSKAQRKALEAQRMALEKQLEAIDRRLEELGEEGDEIVKDDGTGGSKKVEAGASTKEDAKPSLPPESAP